MKANQLELSGEPFVNRNVNVVFPRGHLSVTDLHLTRNNVKIPE